MNRYLYINKYQRPDGTVITLSSGQVWINKKHPERIVTLGKVQTMWEIADEPNPVFAGASIPEDILLSDYELKQ